MRRERGRRALEQRAPAHSAKDVEVEEVHAAEDEQDRADLGAEVLDQFLQARRLRSVPQGERDVADIDQVEADEKQVIDGIRERLIAVKGIDEKDAAIFVEGVRDPGGEGGADDEVEGVRGDGVVLGMFLVL